MHTTGRSCFSCCSLVAVLLLFPLRLPAQLSIAKLGEAWVGSSAQTRNAAKPLNLRSHQDDAIISFIGYQYCVSYSVLGANQAQRYVIVGRRALPEGPLSIIQDAIIPLEH